MKNLLLSVIFAFTAVASSAAAEAWPDLSTAGKKTGDGENDVALLVAVSEYPELDGAMQVPGAVENLEAWQHWLKEVRGVPQVYTLVNKDVGVDDILEKAKKVGQLIKREGTLWFLFIGHGMPHPQERSAMLMTHAANQRHPERNSVALADVVKQLTAKPHKQTVLIVDTCFASGSDHGGKSVFAGTQASVTVKKAALDAATSGAIALTAGGAGDHAGQLPNAQKPAFSYLLLGGLLGWADGAAGAKADGLVTVDEAIAFANGAIAYSNRLTQTPEYSPQNSAVGGTVLAKSAGLANVDVEGLMGGKKAGGGGQKAASVVDCPAGTSWNGSACAGQVVCAAGTTWNGSQCVRAAECEAGSTWDGGKCVRKAVAGAVSCPGGTAWNGSACVGQVVCAAGTTWNGSACVGRAVSVQPAAAPSVPGGGGDMVSFADGRFLMGSPAGVGRWDEHPQHEVTLSAFALDRTEVTVGAYKKCVAAGTCTGTATGFYQHKEQPDRAPFCNYDKSSRDLHPMNCVDRANAFAYCRFVGKRLPTEAQWEYAARSGGRNQGYPWGNEPATCARAILNDGGDGCGENRTWPVCSQRDGNSSQGVCDLAGNVSEWTADWEGAYPAESRSDPTGANSGDGRVVRGGSWKFLAETLRSAFRWSLGPEDRSDFVGFRCAKAL